MDMSNSQYNSASESGWTNYLDQSSSFLSENHFNRRVGYEEKGRRTMEEEEEDLSMVSDASSGPPQYYHVDQDDQQPYTKESEKKVKEFGRNQQQHSPLDDTATSSPVLNNYPKKKGAVENTSFSATRIKTLQRKAKIQKHFGGKQASEEPGGFDDEEERK